MPWPTTQSQRNVSIDVALVLKEFRYPIDRHLKRLHNGLCSQAEKREFLIQKLTGVNR